MAVIVRLSGKRGGADLPIRRSTSPEVTRLSMASALIDGPGPLARRLVVAQLVLALQRQRDLVEPVQDALAQRLVLEGERDLAARGQHDDAPLEVDGRRRGRRVEQLRTSASGSTAQTMPTLRAVRAEDVGEARRDDGAEARVLERPRRMLARRARAEVLARREDRRARELGAVEREVGILAPLEEEALGEARALDPLEELLGDDLVGVDVRAVERRDRAR